MEAISTFDIFKIGVGPSSSHTMGPWVAGRTFVDGLQSECLFESVVNVRVHLYGSLAKTGLGHGTDMALMLGLSGEDPVTIAVSEIPHKLEQIRRFRQILLGGRRVLSFDPQTHLLFHHDQSLPFHSNALQFDATLENGQVFRKTYYSVGGGFIVEDGAKAKSSSIAIPCPIQSGEELLMWCASRKSSISGIVFENEKAWRTEEKIQADLGTLWHEMKMCVYRGCHAEGLLPGGLNVHRRAGALNRRLLHGGTFSSHESWIEAVQMIPKSFQEMLNWVSCFALAVNEENANFGRIVTAPTNGAAGVIPAVLHYYRYLCPNVSDRDVMTFLLTAAEIGSLFKKGSTISAAMGGCQAEIGVSSAMAAAALTECMGGDPEQALMAAEIAMEHHLGMTCDPIGGLVQIPCIERNTMGAIKAITASQIALNSDPKAAKVSLDAVIKTMWSTAQDMSHKYKETAEGGLATHVPVSVPEC